MQPKAQHASCVRPPDERREGNRCEEVCRIGRRHRRDWAYARRLDSLNEDRVREKASERRMPFLRLGRLREEGRRGTVVVVGIVEPVGVELHPVVVEVEDRRVREVAIGLRRIVSTHPCHRTSSLTSCWKQDYTLPLLNLIRRYPHSERNPS